MSDPDIPETRRHHFYDVLFSRRDVRGGQFLPDPVPRELLARLLYAAHHAPSVGLSQPWNFILVDDREVRQAVYEEFQRSNREAEQRFEQEGRGAEYRRLRLEGILEAPVNLCVTCDRRRGGPTVLGKTRQPDMDLYSTVCAVQNLWLAARSEGLGMGWVSILDARTLSGIFGLPEQVVPVAYLCLGYVRRFHECPELEKKDWDRRLPLEQMVFSDGWERQDKDDPLYAAIEQWREFPRRHTLQPGEEGGAE